MVISYSPKLLLGGSLIPIGGIPFLLTSVTSNKLNQTAPYWNRLVEVWFYGKDASKPERIKVWIEDLSKVSKAEYLDNSNSTEKWKLINDNKKYSFLAELARYYLLTQHRINVIASNDWLNKEAKNIKEVKCDDCKSEECATKNEFECFLKNCKERKEVIENKETVTQDQQSFAVYLTNLYSNWNNAYFQPLQAHIYLGDDIDLKQDNEPKPKTITGTTVYGFTDYSYKEVERPSFDEYKDLIKTNKEKLQNRKYFANYPQTFSWGDESNNKDINLKKIYEDLDKNKETKREAHDNHEGECKGLKCLIAKNYVKSLTTLEHPFKDIVKCSKQK